jgi:hypothetical protein
VANEAALKIKAALDPANAQIEELKARIVSIQDANKSASAAARQMGSATRAEMREAQHAVHLLGDEIGVKVPRHLRGVIASLPGFSSALSFAFAPAAAFALFELFEKFIEHIPKMTDALSGFGETEKKVFDAYKKDNQEALRQSKELLHLQRNQVLAGLSGPARTAKELQFQNDDIKLTQKQLEDKIKEFRTQGAELQKTILAREVTPYAGLADAVAGKLGGTDIGGKAKEELGALNVAVRELTGSLSLQKQEAKNTGDTLKRDYAASLREIKDKVTALVTTPVAITGENDAAIRQKFEAMTFDIQKAQKKGVISAREAAKEIDVVYTAMYNVLEKNAEQHALNIAKTNQQIANTAKSQIEAVLSVPVASIFNPMEKYKDLVKDTTSALEAERAQEQAITESVHSGNIDEIAARAKLNALHRETVDNLRDQVTEIQRIALASKDESLINEAKKLSAELDKLNAKVRTLGQTLKVDFEDKFSDAFASIISGTQSAKEAFRSMAQAIIAEIAKIIAKMLVLRAVNAVVGAFTGAKGGGGVPTFSAPTDLVIAGHASGGFFPANMPFIAGEEGPEMIFPSTSGRVAPNYAMRGNSQSGTTILVDARGADAGVEQRVMRAMQIMHDQTVARAVNVISERSRRRT